MAVVDESCTNCGAPLAEGAQFCRECGTARVAPRTECPVCANRVEPDDRFCLRCGHDLSEPAPHAWAARSSSWTMLAMGAIWLAAVLIAVFTPDLVSGADQESFPMAVPVALFWALITSATVLAVSGGRINAWLAFALTDIWAAVTLVSILAPDMVSGTDPTTLPIAMLCAVFAGSVASILLVSVAGRRTGPEVAVGTALVWLGVVLVSVLVPEIETGSDPTLLPLAAIIAPMAGAVLTLLIALFGHTPRSTSRSPRIVGG